MRTQKWGYEVPFCGTIDREGSCSTVRVKIITGSLVTLENLFPQNHRPSEPKLLHALLNYF